MQIVLFLYSLQIISYICQNLYLYSRVSLILSIKILYYAHKMGKSMAPKSDFKWFGTDSIRPIIVFGLSLRLFWATTFTTTIVILGSYKNLYTPSLVHWQWSFADICFSTSTLVVSRYKICGWYSIVFLVGHLYWIGVQIGEDQRTNTVNTHDQKELDYTFKF